MCTNAGAVAPHVSARPQGRLEPIPLEPVDALTVTMLVDNVVDVFMPDDGPARRFGLTPTDGARIATNLMDCRSVSDQLRAEHGFSAMVTVQKNNRSRELLFDAGVTPDGLVENMRRMELAPDAIEAVVLSHGHFDHTTGLDGFARALGPTRLPVVIHPDFWSKRRITLPGREPWVLPSTSRVALEELSFEIIEQQQPSFLLDRSVLVTGEVPRGTDFETGFPLQQALRGGTWEPDPLVLDDQALIVHLRDKGLVVLTGCGHAGVVNTVAYARALTGVDEVHAVIGGFHLNGPLFEPLIPRVCEAFAQLRPRYLVPAHCTGWRAAHALAAAFPEAYLQTAVGTRFAF